MERENFAKLLRSQTVTRRFKHAEGVRLVNILEGNVRNQLEYLIADEENALGLSKLKVISLL
jgi:hypothetical protein